MDYQRGCFELGGVFAGGPFLVERTIGPRLTFEFPFHEPQLFGAAIGRFGVEYAVMGHQALEAVGMT